MKQSTPTSLAHLDQPQYQKYNDLKVDVSKPFEQKQIDTRWIQLKLNGQFIPRSYFASCIQAGKVYIHGGYNEEKGILSDFVQAQFYDLPSQWNTIKVRSPKQQNPPALRNHTMCPYTSNLILFGGQKNMMQNNNTFYKFDLRTGQWQILKTIFQNGKKLPISLDSHIAKIYNNCMYIFGGYESENGTYSNGLYCVDLKNLAGNEVIVSQVKLKTNVRPQPRGNFCGCVVENELFIFGGTNSDDIFDDMWCFSFEKSEWTQIKKSQNKQWPQKRKGHVMVSHPISRTIFMFGGIRQITKQQNDIVVFIVARGKWIRIHKNTNQLYYPSPTIKKLQETSPSIIDAKNRKLQKNASQPNQPFKFGLKSVAVYNVKSTTEIPEEGVKNSKNRATEHGGFGGIKNQIAMKKHMTLVEEKRHKDFILKKKKLLSEVTKEEEMSKQKRPHSPTSQTLKYSIDTIGEQKKYPQNFHNDLPKVIFDEQKGVLIGKKPCARDGHAGLAYEDSIIIIGGDRHMMAFNDVYLFKMDKAINFIHVYQ